MKTSIDHDRGDADIGDIDPEDDRHRHYVNVSYHQSHEQVTPPTLAVERTDIGITALEYIKALTAHAAATKKLVEGGRPRAATASWHDLPQLYRRMVAAAAGVPGVVEKKDRDLTEEEKVMMRSAIADMRQWLGSVAAL